LESDPDEDGPAYLVEREEKLCQLTCAAAVVDQHHCRGSRSLRWDLLPVRTKGGVLHAKVTVLHWSKATRLIVASANLTADGYRRNQEVFGILDYTVEGKSPIAVLRDTLDFLRRTLAADPGAEASPATGRASTFLDRVWKASKEWGEDNDQHARHPLQVKFVSSMPGSPDVLATLSSIWPGGAPPARACILSPFFDPPEGDNRPAVALWDIMRKRGVTQVAYCVEVDEIAGEESPFAKAPANLQMSKPSRESASIHFLRLKLPPGRPLHAKAIWLEDDRWATYIIGSSNFTSPGLGLGKSPNIEANLVYLVDARRDGNGCERLQQAIPPYDEIEDSSELNFRPPADGVTDSANDEDLLPEAFAAASYDHTDGKGTVGLTFKGVPPKGWFLLKDSAGKEAWFSEVEWINAGSPATAKLPWADMRPPSGFWVRWTGCGNAAWLPVNVFSGAALPPPEELRDLPLEALINILTSARPLHQALRVCLAQHARAATGGGDNQPVSMVDPHKRVDTTGFLLQRTRRVSLALNELKVRLQRPVVSKESLEWRLRGPVGVLALWNALDKEATSNEERMFLLSELALELDRCTPTTADGCLPVSVVRSAILRLAGEIMDSIHRKSDIVAAEMRHYMDHVAEAIHR
jgi:hypothetical protein